MPKNTYVTNHFCVSALGVSNRCVLIFHSWPGWNACHIVCRDTDEFRWTSNIVIRESSTSDIPSPQALADPNNTLALGRC